MLYLHVFCDCCFVSKYCLHFWHCYASTVSFTEIEIIYHNSVFLWSPPAISPSISGFVCSILSFNGSFCRIPSSGGSVCINLSLGGCGCSIFSLGGSDRSIVSSGGCGWSILYLGDRSNLTLCVSGCVTPSACGCSILSQNSVLLTYSSVKGGAEMVVPMSRNLSSTLVSWGHTTSPLGVFQTQTYSPWLQLQEHCLHAIQTLRMLTPSKPNKHDPTAASMVKTVWNTPVSITGVACPGKGCPWLDHELLQPHVCFGTGGVLPGEQVPRERTVQALEQPLASPRAARHGLTKTLLPNNGFANHSNPEKPDLLEGCASADMSSETLPQHPPQLIPMAGS